MMEKQWEQLFIREMDLRGFAQETKVSYLRATRKLVNHYRTDPKDITLDQIKDFLQLLNGTLAKGRSTKITPSTINNHTSAIRCLYLSVYQRDYSTVLPRQIERKHTPLILTQDEVNSMIDSIHSVFYKAVIMLLYSTGMRQKELRTLKISDLDSSRMVIYIRNAKGKKDRQAKLFPNVLAALRTYWRLFRFNSVKSEFLFIPSKNSYDGELKKSLSHTAVGYILKTAAEAAGIKKKFILIA